MQPPTVILPDDGCLPQAETMGQKKKDDDESDSNVMRRWAHKRTAKLSPERRKEIASNAAKARWAKRKKVDSRPEDA